ncbi:MAG TPA: PepSY domain-containing protein [Hyphomonadaceae bacterium]|mgnify:CR=1 FL=1|nr:PepSY domain-containing protein [Hyphomonadaceae bacterium]HPN04245.1 PepSY domain-containing protein [Hyphomonadaceae bacterium]
MIMKTLIVVHRYLGVVLGVIMTMWCLSGFVMMYQGYPATTPDERQSGLERLDLANASAQLTLAGDAPAMQARVEMLSGAPVLRVGGRDGPKAYNLESGETVGVLSEQQVRNVAETYAAGNKINGKITELDTLLIDQWSVQPARRSQPLWKAVFDDPGASWVYINGSNGEVVQDANGHERFWNWLGAIPHWLYPRILRENGQLWNDVVVYSSLIGCFLVITGMVIGFVRLRGRSGKWWPYRNRPMWMWHHLFGTFAGVLVLTWTFSGMMTMSPFGLLESEGAVSRADVQSPMQVSEVQAILEQVKANPPANLVTLRAAPLLGKPYLIARSADGADTRFGLNGAAPLTQEELQAGLSAKGGVLASGKLEVLNTEDDYYYGHKRAVDLPVYRVTLTDPDSTKAYFDYKTGELRQLADGTGQRYRWFEAGLHSMDFSFMRARPVWDIVTLLLLAAVTIACATGAWMSFTRVGQDFSRIRQRFARKSKEPSQL